VRQELDHLYRARHGSGKLIFHIMPIGFHNEAGKPYFIQQDKKAASQIKPGG
jgi:hypothetical protein